MLTIFSGPMYCIRVVQCTLTMWSNVLPPMYCIHVVQCTVPMWSNVLPPMYCIHVVQCTTPNVLYPCGPMYYNHVVQCSYYPQCTLTMWPNVLYPCCPMYYNHVVQYSYYPQYTITMCTQCGIRKCLSSSPRSSILSITDQVNHRHHDRSHWPRSTNQGSPSTIWQRNIKLLLLIF